ncbi:MAG: hypothetical protein ACRDNF_24870 [Streptosporangiaceae bacterium]
MTEHPALAALNPPERQLAAAFLQWLATIEDTRTQITADMAAAGLDTDKAQVQARLRDAIAATRAGLDPGQRRNFDWLFSSLHDHLAATEPGGS